MKRSASGHDHTHFSSNCQCSGDANSFWCLQLVCGVEISGPPQPSPVLPNQGVVALNDDSKAQRGSLDVFHRMSRFASTVRGAVSRFSSYWCTFLMPLSFFMKEMAYQCAGNRDRPGAVQRAIADTEPLAAFVNSQIAALQPAGCGDRSSRSQVENTWPTNMSRRKLNLPQADIEASSSGSTDVSADVSADVSTDVSCNCGCDESASESADEAARRKAAKQDQSLEIGTPCTAGGHKDPSARIEIITIPRVRASLFCFAFLSAHSH